MAFVKLVDFATQLADQFIPARLSADREAKKQARIFLYSHLFGPFIGFSVPFAMFAFDPVRDFKVSFLFLSIGLFWAFPLLLKRTGAYRVLCFLSIQNLICCILWGCYFYGGVHAPTLAWLLTIPLLAFLYIGPSWRLRMGLAAQFAASALAFLLINQAYDPPPLTMSAVAIQGLGLVSTVAATLYVAMMALFYGNALASQVELRAEMDGHLRTTADLVAAIESTRRSSAAKAEFIAKMSHELRTPLNAVIGYSEMLLEEVEGEADAQSAADLRRIRNAGVHLLKLVNEILDLSRIEAGRMDVCPELADFGDVVRAAAARYEEAARVNGDVLVVDVADAPSALWIDAAKLGQILDTLLENAVAFTVNGEVRLTVRPGAEDGFMRIEIADTGCGIAPERLEGFLERLETVEEADGRQHGGAGVGLLLCKRLCELIGARLSLHSAAGVGTRVAVDVPMRADESEILDAAARAGARLGAIAEEMRREMEKSEGRESDAETAAG